MSAQQVTLQYGYPTPWGQKKAFVIEVNGPALYATGGQTITAAQLGIGGIDAVIATSRSYSGTYAVRDVQYLAVDAAPSAAKGAVASVKVPWYNVSDGLEVTPATVLTTERMRLVVIGV